LFVSNAPNVATLERYYANSETMRKDGGADEIERSVYSEQAILLPALDGLRVVEIGCDTGRFLDYLNDFGADTWFVESSERARAVLFKNGRHREWRASLGACSAVILMHTLEHIPQPVKWLQTTLAAALAEDGLLLIEVPDWTRLNGVMDSLSFEHLHQFSAASMASLIQRAGLHLESLSYAQTPGYHTTPNRVLRVTARRLPYKDRHKKLVAILDHSELTLRRNVRSWIDAHPDMTIGLYAASWYTQDLLTSGAVSPAEIYGLYDSDHHKIGVEFFGLRVSAPSEIQGKRPEAILVLSSYENEIVKSLRTSGYVGELVLVSSLRDHPAAD
jgi:hypothetical protein